jgi:hypothetical protein
MAEKGYMFLLGLFFKNWGLKRLLLENGLYVDYIIVSKG